VAKVVAVYCQEFQHFGRYIAIMLVE